MLALFLCIVCIFYLFYGTNSLGEVFAFGQRKLVDVRLGEHSRVMRCAYLFIYYLYCDGSLLVLVVLILFNANEL